MEANFYARPIRTEAISLIGAGDWCVQRLMIRSNPDRLETQSPRRKRQCRIGSVVSCFLSRVFSFDKEASVSLMPGFTDTPERIMFQALGQLFNTSSNYCKGSFTIRTLTADRKAYSHLDVRPLSIVGPMPAQRAIARKTKLCGIVYLEL